MSKFYKTTFQWIYIFIIALNRTSFHTNISETHIQISNSARLIMRLAHTTAAWNSSYRNWEMEWWLITKSKIFETMTFSLLLIFTFIAIIVFCKQPNSASDTNSIVFQEINKSVLLNWQNVFEFSCNVIF